MHFPIDPDRAAPTWRTPRERSLGAPPRRRLWPKGALALTALCGFACAEPQGQDATEVAEPEDAVPSHMVSSPPHPELTAPTDAARAGDHWFVLDLGANQVHQFDLSGELVASFAGRGGGPGELAIPRSIAGRGDTVAVLDGSSIELFSASGNFIVSRPVLVPGCEGSLINMESLVGLPAGLAVKAQCVRGRQSSTLVVRETETGLWRILASSEATDLGSAAIAGALSVLVHHPDGFVFGSANDACLTVYSVDGVPLREVCHDRLPRHPLPDHALAKIESIEAKAGALGLDLDTPSTLPPFYRVFGREQGLLYQTIDSTSEDLDSPYYHLVRQDEAGNQVPLPVPPAKGFFISGTSVLAHWDAVEGTRVEVFDLAGN